MNRIDFAKRRQDMVDKQVAGRGVHSRLVLDAMRGVPREAFLPEGMHEFAYEDAPLLIAEDEVIAQPYVVALMLEALRLEGGEKVLEIGTGCGYATAVLARIARSVYTVEQSDALALKTAALLAGLGCGNVHALHAPASPGWPDHAPYDAIMVNAGARHVPQALKGQLRIGGRLVMPAGVDQEILELVRVTRVSQDEYKEEDIADIRFAPLLDEQGAASVHSGSISRRAAEPTPDQALANDIAASCEKFATVNSADLEPLLRRIGEARIVLIGEATHGTSEFYQMRARISRELIERKNFSFIAIEGDWPDAARVDHYVRHAQYAPSEWTAFSRFPVWMWRNQETRAFVDWLRKHNSTSEVVHRVAFHGLDLYSLYNSIRSVLSYLDDVDPPSARVARQRYGCLTPWQSEPASYGHAALTATYQTCEREVIANLTGLLKKHQIYAERDGERFLDAVQNARLVANAERYYRTMYYGSRASWNLRDSHMFETLKNLLTYHGAQSKAIIWAHNSHVGDSAATEMSLRGEYNIGHLCRKEFGRAACRIGFGTNRGTVAAASDWDAPMQVKTVRDAMAGSYERLCHEAGVARFVLPLRSPAPEALIAGLSKPRLERAIGVIYRPETELQSHYFKAVLPLQFDEYIWFDETQAVTPLKTEEIEGFPQTYPFGL
jgi:protein-L-isoaspartate(D-aspartate) O-methyltransferase